MAYSRLLYRSGRRHGAACYSQAILILGRPMAQRAAYGRWVCRSTDPDLEYVLVAQFIRMLNVQSLC